MTELPRGAQRLSLWGAVVACTLGLGHGFADAPVTGSASTTAATSYAQAEENVLNAGGSNPSNATLKLIPQPKSLRTTPGTLELGPPVCVIAASPELAGDSEVLAQDLSDRLAQPGNACPSDNVPAESVTVTLALQDSLEGVPQEAHQAYALDIDRDGVRITGVDADGAFFGTQTLLQIIDNFDSPEALPCLSIRDWPDMRYRGTQHDTRGQIAQINTLKKHIRTLAYFKYNQFYIYIENMFRYSKHPDIPPECALEPDQVAELVEFARRYHVDVVPMQQSLGHQAQLLRVPAYTHLAESQEHIPGTNYLWVLSPAYEETYKLLGDMYEDIVGAFPSKFFHAACDEAGTLGKGASRELAEKIGIGGVFVRHIERLRALLPTDRRLGIWGDMLLGHKDEVEGRMPKDTIIYDWHYIPQDDGYPSVKWFRDQGLDVFVCPANLGYGKVFPHVQDATLNMERFVEVGKSRGAMGMLNCVWELWYQNFFDFVWYGLVYGADAAWSGDKALREPASFNARFARVFFRSDRSELGNLFRILGEPNRVLHEEWPSARWFQVMKMFWEDPRRQEYVLQMNDLSLKNLKYRMFTRTRLAAIAARILVSADEALRELERSAPEARANREVLDALRYAACRYRFFAHRLQYMQSARDAYAYALEMRDHKTAVAAALADARELVRALAGEVKYIEEMMARLWHERRQSLGLDRAAGYYTRSARVYSEISAALLSAQNQYTKDGTLPAAGDVGLEQIIPTEPVPGTTP